MPESLIIAPTFARTLRSGRLGLGEARGLEELPPGRDMGVP